MKRAFDLSCAITGLLLLWPLFVLIALTIKLSDGGPVFFWQRRVGHQGRLFRMWKFRTMVVNAEKLGGHLTADGDTRTTRVGRVLRRYKLDELPQLFNIVRGEMSLVGPRPEVPYYVDRYSAEQRAVLEVVPGITDPASIAYRREGELLARSPDPEHTYVHEIMPEKIRLNLAYASRAGVVTDFMVILKTLFRIVR